jgi:hypothetical protein
MGLVALWAYVSSKVGLTIRVAQFPPGVRSRIDNSCGLYMSLMTYDEEGWKNTTSFG